LDIGSQGGAKDGREKKTGGRIAPWERYREINRSRRPVGGDGEKAIWGKENVTNRLITSVPSKTGNKSLARKQKLIKGQRNRFKENSDTRKREKSGGSVQTSAP